VFQIHSAPVYKNPENRSDREHWAWLQQPHPFPIWMQELDPQIPSCARYPLEAITAAFLGRFTWPDGNVIQFFTNSISYAIALAIFKGYDEIHIYGTEMGSQTEYHYQRVNVAFWTGIALGQGARIVQHCARAIYDVPRYGYDGAITLEIVDFGRGMDEMTAQAEARAAEANAALDAEREAMEAGEGFEEAHQKTLDALIAVGTAEGIVGEAKRYITKAEKMTEATGEVTIHRQEFEIVAAQAANHAEKFKAMMNFDSGRALVMWEMYKASKDERFLQAFNDYSEKQLTNARAAGNAEGRRQANLSYLAEVDERIRAAGGSKAVDAFQQGAS
jgi:D-alanyl-D-alanine dipeptidase